MYWFMKVQTNINSSRWVEINDRQVECSFATKPLTIVFSPRPLSLDAFLLASWLYSHTGTLDNQFHCRQMWNIEIYCPCAIDGEINTLAHTHDPKRKRFHWAEIIVPFGVTGTLWILPLPCGTGSVLQPIDPTKSHLANAHWRTLLPFCTSITVFLYTWDQWLFSHFSN